MVLIEGDRLVERIVADAAVDDDVELLGRELVEEVGGVRLGDGERDVWVAAAERLDHRRQEARGEEVRAAKPQRAALEPREVVAVALEVALDAEDALGGLDVGAAGVGQLQRRGAAVEDRQAELSLDLAHGGRERGLRDEELAGGGGEALLLPDGVDVIHSLHVNFSPFIP